MQLLLLLQAVAQLLDLLPQLRNGLVLPRKLFLLDNAHCADLKLRLHVLQLVGDAQDLRAHVHALERQPLAQLLRRSQAALVTRGVIEHLLRLAQIVAHLHDGFLELMLLPFG